LIISQVFLHTDENPTNTVNLLILIKYKKEPEMVLYFHLHRRGQEEHEFEASFGNVKRPFVNK
jgi:hypothetical protein